MGDQSEDQVILSAFQQRSALTPSKIDQGNYDWMQRENRLRPAIAVCVATSRNSSGRAFADRPFANVKLHALFAQCESRFTPAQAGILTYLDLPTTRIVSSQDQMLAEFRRKVSNFLLPNLTSTIDLFAKYEPVADPLTLVSNIVGDFAQVFGGPLEDAFASSRSLESLLASDRLPTIDGRTEYKRRETANFASLLAGDSIEALAEVCQFLGHGDKGAHHEDYVERLGELRASLDEFGAAILDCVHSQYTECVYQEMLWFDYFLQCSRIVAVVESVWAHPPAAVFRSFLDDLHFSCPWDDATIGANVRLMGESKAAAVDEKIDLIVHFHGELFKKCPKLLMLAVKARDPGVANPRKHILDQIETDRKSPIASASIVPAPETTEEEQGQAEEDAREEEQRQEEEQAREEGEDAEEGEEPQAQCNVDRTYLFPPGFLEMFQSQSWTTVRQVKRFGSRLKAAIAVDPR
jgi:hypothetical protein